MRNYVIRRVLYCVAVVFGVLLLTFLLFTVVVGDISVEIAGECASRETIEEIREEYGLNKPLFLSVDSQFVSHFKSTVTFDFGRARDRELVIDKIKRGVGPSLSLTAPIFFGTAAIAVSLSLVIAFVRGSAWDVAAVVVCTAGMSIPYLGFILLGQYFLAYKWGLFPVFFSPDLTTAQNVALPVLIGIAAGLGGNVRFYRTVMLDEMRSNYVRTAFAKGLSVRGVLFGHVLKNAMIPIITRMAMSVPFLFLGSLLLERFFGIPGVGHLMVQAIAARDYNVVSAMTYIGAILFVVFNLIADICYAAVDPRLSVE